MANRSTKSIRSASRLTIGAVALSLAVLLTGCSSAIQDRSGGAGTEPDSYEDATEVKLFRNANNVPNVAYFCLGEYGWASTLSGGDSGADKASALVRFGDYDPICTGLEGSAELEEPR